MLRNGKGYAFWMRPLVGPCTELKREREIRNFRTRESFAFAFVALRLRRPRAWASFAAMCGIVCSSLTPPLQRGERAHLSGFVKRTRPLRCSWHGAAQTKAIRRQCARCYLSRRRSRFCRVRFSPGLAALWLRSSSRIACAASTTRWKGRTSRSVGCDSAKGSPHRPFDTPAAVVPASTL